jgi:hypothetical protein
MGQYYKPCILNKKNKTTVEAFMHAHSHGNGLKLMEHSYIGNDFVGGFETLIQEKPQRVVWGGDYAEPCINRKTNTYERCIDKLEVKPSIPNQKEYHKEFVFIVNHSKKEYVDKREVKDIPTWKGTQIHPLPLLTSEGNGQGGGDFFGKDTKGLIGTWARDIISIEKESFVNETILLSYKKIKFDLVE